MTNLDIPEILQLPDKLYPILTKLNDVRYVLLDGGRGGGKSQALARIIAYLCEKHKLRVVCGREIQNSISESVYSLLVDLIRTHNLNFEILSTRITHRKTGSTINFRGFRDQGVFNIQGMEGVDIVWIDEAQAITQKTLDVLIPTIRKDKAKIFFSMNRHVENDPVFDMFNGRQDCLNIHLNYFDNPFCTEALKNEAEECKKKSIKDYNHIWLGEPLAQTEDSVFGRGELNATKKNDYSLKEGYGLRIAGYDIARYGDDKCAVVILQQQGALHWRVIHADQWDKMDLNYTTGRILSTANENRVDRNIIDENGIGAGPLDTITKGREIENFTGFMNLPLSHKEDKFYANIRTKNTYKLKDLVLKGHIAIPYDEIIDELITLKYDYDNYQRKRLVSKEKMRKDGIKSPNLADALIYAVSLIGDIRYDQENLYMDKMPQYSKEDNLFTIGGIR